MASPQEIFQQAVALQVAGDAASAAAIYATLLRANPGHPELLHRAGTAFHQLGRTPEAERMIRAAVESTPENASYRHNLAVVLQALDRSQDAVAQYEAALRIEPLRVDSLALLGGILSVGARREEGVRLMRRAMVLDPAHREALDRMANFDQMVSDHASSMRRRRMALALVPDDAPALVAAGLTAIEVQQTTRARDLFHASSVVSPASVEPYNHCGYLDVAHLRIAEARRQFSRAMVLQPSLASVSAGLSEAAFATGEIEKSIEWMRHAVRLSPVEPHFRFRLGIQLLSVGQTEEGWENYQQIRAKQGSVKRPPSLSFWSGEPMPEGTLLVGADQGVGDEILHAACIHDAARDVGDVIIECDPRIVGLMKRSFPSALVHAFDRVGDRSAPEHLYDWVPKDRWPDAYTDGATLLAKYRGTIDQADAAASPWLVADPARVDAMRQTLAGIGDGLKVGLAWRSRRLTAFRLTHYPGLSAFEDVLAVDGVDFVSLQYGVGWQDELASSGAPVSIIDGLDTTDDIDGVLALIEALDLVICPSSTVGWLAASLGKPVWLLYNTPIFLEYGTQRFPGFPSVRSFRKLQVDPWRPLMRRVASALSREVAGRSVSPGQAPDV